MTRVSCLRSKSLKNAASGDRGNVGAGIAAERGLETAKSAFWLVGCRERRQLWTT